MPARCSCIAPRGRRIRARRASPARRRWRNGLATEAAGRVCDRAVQLFGGRGVTRGEIVERLYRDVRALRIYEGASEIQQVVIAAARARKSQVSVRPDTSTVSPREEPSASRKRCRSCASTFPSCSIPNGSTLIDRAARRASATARRARRCILAPDGICWTYARAAARANRIARVLVEDFGSSPAIACCCARRTRRCWRQAGAQCSRRAPSR